MNQEADSEKLVRFLVTLEQFLGRLSEDRNVLAAVLVGSLQVSTIWRRESIHLWIVEADGVTRRIRSDGNDERIFRILVENGINFHVELIPRTRFKQMVEGASRTAFSCNFFAERSMVYCADPSIEKWFESANTVATKDRDRELLTFTTWTIHSVRHARRRLELQSDLPLAFQETIGAAHSIAYTEIIRLGKICETDPIYPAIEANPELFRTIYLDVLSDGNRTDTLRLALDRIDRYLEEHWQVHLSPLIRYLTKANRTVPLSEMSDYFAFSEVYPWHLESACEWLESKGRLAKISAPFKLTKRSLESVEEPAYFWDAEISGQGP